MSGEGTMSVTGLRVAAPNRRGLHALGLLLAGLVVGAVAAWMISVPVPVPASGPAPEDLGVSGGDAFVFAVRGWSAEQVFWTGFDERSDRAVVGLGEQVCAELDDGREWSEVQTRMSGILGGEGTEPDEQADILLSYATTYICPHHDAPPDESNAIGPL